MNKVKKLLCVGDTVYSANGGLPMKIISMSDNEFSTEEDTFDYDEVRKTFFLTKAGYEYNKHVKEAQKKCQH